MRFLIPAAACCALLLCALFAGCTSPTQAEIQPAGTTVATTVETTQTVAPTPTPEAIAQLPINQAVDFSVNKDRPTGQDHPPVQRRARDGCSPGHRSHGYPCRRDGGG